MAAPPITERHLHHFHRRSPIKESVRVATTANITIATALNNGDTLDGITLATDDRVLVKDQTAPAENGLYVVAASPARAYDQSTDDPAFGFLVYVRSGTVGGGSLWRNTNTSTPTIGTTGLTFAQITSASSGALPWFNVKSYGAIGDGTIDDTAAINLAIAALNTAGKGVLYFPPGEYKVTAALTTITVGCTVQGDGINVSQITSTSTTAVLLTLTAVASRVIGLRIHNSSVATSGAAIVATGGTANRYDDLWISGFWIGLDQQAGNSWAVRGCAISGVRKYAIKVTNVAIPDEGDWSISDFVSSSIAGADALIRIESSGGGKITNFKLNGATTLPVGGIDVAIGSGSDTSVLLISNGSIENVSGDAIRVVTTGTGRFGHIIIDGVQVGLYTNNTGRAVKLSAANTGSYPAAGTIGIVSIDGGVFYTNGTARAAVELVNADNIVLGDFAIAGFTSRYTSSGATNITDAAAVTYATPAIVLGSAAAAGAATSVIRSDATIVAFDATTPAAVTVTAATGSAAVAARRDHVHTIDDAAVMGAGYWDVVVSGSAPPVAVSTPSDDDWLVAWVNT